MCVHPLGTRKKARCSAGNERWISAGLSGQDVCRSKLTTSDQVSNARRDASCREQAITLQVRWSQHRVRERLIR